MVDDAQTRKLATIVSLDVAGYSARTEADEARTTAEVAALRKVIEGIAVNHGGRVFNTAGDGFMLEFGSSLAGVEAAFELAEKCVPQVRVGVHLGDVALQPNGDLLGHGVNVAARLMAQAKPGSALVSADVQRTLRGPLAQSLRSRGTIKLAKMSEAIEVFALEPGAGVKREFRAQLRNLLTVLFSTWGAIAVATLILAGVAAIASWTWFPPTPKKGAPALQTEAAQVATVAVLPFDNLTGDPALVYLSNGISAAIQATLMRYPTGLLLADATVKSTTAKKVSDALRVSGTTHVVNGSVTRSGGRVRIVWRLIDTHDGRVVWVEDHERSLDRSPDLQAEIARRVALFLRVAALGLSAPPGRIPPEALDQYLRAVDPNRVSSSWSLLRDEKNLIAATRAAPDFAAAWMALADNYQDFANYENEAEQAATLTKAQLAAERALNLDPNLGFANAILSTLKSGWNWRTAEAQLTRAVETRGNDVLPLARLAMFLTNVGRLQDAHKVSVEMMDLDPLSPASRSTATRIPTWLGDVTRAETALRAMIDQDPSAAIRWRGLLLSHFKLRDVTAARRALREYERHLPTLREIQSWTPEQEARQLSGAREQMAQLERDARISDTGKKQRWFDELSGAQLGQSCALEGLVRLSDVRLGPELELAWRVAETVYVERGYVGTTATCRRLPVYPQREAETWPLFARQTTPLRRDVRIWRIFNAEGLAKYWLETGHWPDFCAERDLPYDCKVEAKKVVQSHP